MVNGTAAAANDCRSVTQGRSVAASKDSFKTERSRIQAEDACRSRPQAKSAGLKGKMFRQTIRNHRFFSGHRFRSVKKAEFRRPGVRAQRAAPALQLGQPYSDCKPLSVLVRGQRSPVFLGVGDDGLVGMSARAMYSRPYLLTLSAIAKSGCCFSTLSDRFTVGRGGASSIPCRSDSASDGF